MLATLVDATTDLIIQKFTQNLGLTLEETVAMIGAGHSIANSRRPGSILIDMPLDSTPNTMDVKYFQELASSPSKPFSANVGRILSDSNMMLNDEMKGYVETFAKDEARFRQVLQSTMEKMMDLGATIDTTKDSTMDTESVMVSFPILSTCSALLPNPVQKVASPNSALNRGISSWVWLVGLLDGLLFV